MTVDPVQGRPGSVGDVGEWGVGRDAPRGKPETTCTPNERVRGEILGGRDWGEEVESFKNPRNLPATL